MISKFKLVAVDLDGTLLDDNQRLSSANKSSIISLNKAGVKVILASGRLYTSVLPFAKACHLNNPIIACNGAVILETKPKKVLFALSVPWIYADEIIKCADKDKFHLNLYDHEKVYIKEMNKWAKLYEKRTKSKMVIVKNLSSLSGVKIPKLIIVSDPKTTAKLFGQFQKQYKGKLSVMRTYPEYLEFMNRNVSKGQALQFIMKKFNIKKKEVLAMGDSYNDIDLFKAAGFKVAVSNACDELKWMADYITTRNNKNGFAEAINKFVL